jgi:hypothetical protein
MKRKHQLDIYMEAMRHCSHRFDFGNVVSGIISNLLHVVEPTQSAGYLQMRDGSSDASLKVPESTRPRSWIDIVTQQPQLYLKISFLLDYSLSRGKYPSDSELPVWNIDSSTSKVPNGPALSMDTTNQVATMSPEKSSSMNLSPMRDDTVQLPHLSEADPLSSNAFSQPYCIGNAVIEYDMFGMANFMGTDFGCSGFDEASERTEENNAAQTQFEMLSNTSDTTSAGSFDRLGLDPWVRIAQ